MAFQFHDGGRSRYFSNKVAVADCVPRAISIATGEDYKRVYDDLAALAVAEGLGNKSVSNGSYKQVYGKYLASLGWHWQKVKHPAGRKARPADLPAGVFVASMAGHLAAVDHGDVKDIYDCSDKMVYGYYAHTGEKTDLFIPRSKREGVLHKVLSLTKADQRWLINQLK